MWPSIYASPLHHPTIAWVAVVVGALVLASRLPFLAGYLVVFGLEMAADALASSPFLHMPQAASTALTVGFVITGDFRYFLLAERNLDRRGLTVRAFVYAVLWAFVVPLTATAIRLSVPAVENTVRLQFMVYEGLFVVLAATFRFVLLPRRTRELPAETRAWLYPVTSFVLGHYVLWVVSDVLIHFFHVEAAYGLRLVPNIMYYALFLPFVYRTAPAHERDFVRRAT